jgi:hypothetical protein
LARRPLLERATMAIVSMSASVLLVHDVVGRLQKN